MKYYIFFVVSLLCACHRKEEQLLSGFWRAGDVYLQFKRDTMSIYDPIGGTDYIYTISDGTLIIKRRVSETGHTQYCDSIQNIRYPLIFAELNTVGDANLCITAPCFYFDGAKFRRLLVSRRESGLKKIQFSSFGCGLLGWSMQVDSGGNALISRGFNRPLNPVYSMKLPPDDTEDIFRLASLVDFDHMKTKYRDRRSIDGSGVRFVFYFEEKQMHTEIINTDYPTLIVLTAYLQHKLSCTYFRDSSEYRKVTNFSFENDLFNE